MAIEIYSDESGLLIPNRNQSAYFGLGGLVLPSRAVGRVRARIKELREEYNYFCRIEYKINNKHKIPLCKALLDFYFSDADIGFFAIVIRVADLDWSRWSLGVHHPLNQQPHVAFYTRFYALMISCFCNDYIKKGVDLKVIIDRQSVARREMRNRVDYFRHVQVCNVEERPTRTDDLLQFADLLLGSTVSTYTHFEYPEILTSWAKIEFNRYLLRKLGIPYFWNWRRVGEQWGPSGIKWQGDRKNPQWERPAVRGTRHHGHKFDLFSWHGD